MVISRNKDPKKTCFWCVHRKHLSCIKWGIAVTRFSPACTSWKNGILFEGEINNDYSMNEDMKSKGLPWAVPHYNVCDFDPKIKAYLCRVEIRGAVISTATGEWTIGSEGIKQLQGYSTEDLSVTVIGDRWVEFRKGKKHE